MSYLIRKSFFRIQPIVLKILFEFQQIQESLIDIFFLLSYISKTYYFSGEYYPYALVAQSVEHIVGNDEVTGSSPVAGSTSSVAPDGAFFW